jgi:nicotinic acid mononucleotide adenylyltransferase
MKRVYFTFGRFNPPTIGHEKLIEAVAKAAKTDDWFIIPSQTHKKPKDPLPYAYKAALMKKMFPKYASHIDDTACCNTPISVMEHLMMKDYTDVVMVVGSDRVAGFDKLLKEYNRDPRANYAFDTVEVISAGERDPDADGAAGMSASKMRAAAKDGKSRDFVDGIPDSLSTTEKLNLMAEVRKGMGL